MRSVIAILLSRRGGLISVDQLIDELWQELPSSDPRMLVHGYISRLRRATGARIVTRKPGYLLQFQDNEWDAVLFEQSIVEARSAHLSNEFERAAKLYTAAHELWTAEPFADVPATPLIAATATALGELRLAALGEWFEVRLAGGADPSLISELAHHVLANPLHEKLVAHLMVALHQVGRRAEALSAFRDIRQRLTEELGVEPGGELQAVHQLVLRGASIAPQRTVHRVVANSKPERWTLTARPPGRG